jgi:hypothetical protein
MSQPTPAGQPQPDAKAAIREWLQQRGYQPDEVAKIMAKLAAHDDKTIHEAVFDSIGRGTMSLDDIIREALGK